MKTKSTEVKLQSQTLYELTADSRRIEDLIIENEGELDEITESLRAVIDGRIVSKCDSIGFVLDRVKGQQDYLKANAEMFRKKAKAAESALEYLKQYIKDAMLTLGRDKLDGNLFKFSLSLSAPKLEINEEQLPKEFFKTETVSSPNTELIRKVLEAGDQIPGVRLVQGHTLRKTVQTKKDKFERIE